VHVIERQLEHAGVSARVRRIETASALGRALDEAPPDIVLADYTHPDLEGPAALRLVRDRSAETPFIFLSDEVGEEIAVEALKSGATDFVRKDHLARIGTAVRRALAEADARRERRTAQEQLLKSHEQLRALTAYLQFVREEERTRIAREVHDELGQMLTNLKIELAWLSGRLPKHRRLLQEKARQMLGHIDALAHTVRQIVTELRPGILDDFGLVPALEWQAGEFQRRTGLRCTFASDVTRENWDGDVTTALFRIFQETLTNVLRHARATRVDVHLWQDDDVLLLEIADNGRGITPEEIANTRSIGLLGMRERAALLGGEISFIGASGRGTTVLIRLPIASDRRTGAPDHENSADRRPRDRAPRIETDPGGGIPERGIR
jgi:signal transduction histidine kinase